MIDDKELAALFQAESEEHLQSLDEGLLRLEANPQDSATLEQVFRNAHSLKGAARMLGVETVETLAHHFESALGGAARKQKMLTPESVDRLYQGLDAMRKLVVEAVTGEIAGVDMEQALAQLSGEEIAAPAVAPPTTPAANYLALKSQPSIEPTVADHSTAIPLPPLPAPEIELASTHTLPPEIIVELEQTALAPLAAAPVATSGSAVQAETLAAIKDETPAIVMPEATETILRATPANFKIETIRVEPTKLDALMTLAGELTVTTSRVTRGLAEFESITALWEEWQKDTKTMRSTFQELARRLQDETPSALHGGATSRDVTLKKLATFQEREAARLEQLRTLLLRLRQTTYEDVTRLNFVADEVEESIRRVRLLPLTTVFNLYPRMVRDLAKTQEKEVQLLVEGGETTADKRILEELKDPLMHMIRNSVDHGVEPPDERERAGKPRLATLRLWGYQTATNVIVELSDDGRGLDVAAIKRTALKRLLHSEAELAALSEEQIQLLIFAPGFSTSPLVTDVSGRGVGLDVVRANVEALRGSIHVASSPGSGCRFRIQLPLTLATTRVLLVQVAGLTYALPVEWVQGAYLIAPGDIFSIEGRETTRLQGLPISVARLGNLLEIRNMGQRVRHDRNGGGSSAPAALPPRKTASSDLLPCIVLAIGEERLGLIVDSLVDEQEVMLKPLGAMLKRVRNVSGATILGTGEVCMVLNPQDLMKSAQKSPITMASLTPATTVAARKLILLAEDSITTRTQEKRILEAAGYEVVTAVDGLDAFNKVATRPFDAVVSDVEMPNMTGLDLAAKIRQDQQYNEIPIILVTSLASEADKRRGVEVGANAYITKQAFEQKILLDTLGRLL